MVIDKTKLDCSINDTSILRNLILENPDLPVLIFCGEDAWSREWSYTQADATRGEIEELTLFSERWMNKDEYEEELSEVLCDEGEYKNMSDEEFTEMINKKVAETEFVKAIVIWVG